MNLITSEAECYTIGNTQISKQSIGRQACGALSRNKKTIRAQSRPWFGILVELDGVKAGGKFLNAA